MHFVPSMLQVFLEQGDVSDMFNIGSRHMQRRGSFIRIWYRRFYEVLPETELNNLYGPTEAAVDVTAWRCVLRKRMWVFQSAAQFQTRRCTCSIQGQPTPIGVPGEL